MQWFDKNSHVQTLPQDMVKILADNHWDNFLTYRYRYGADSAPGFKYADVRLFRSTGSDRVKRNLGMVFGYDTAQTPFSDNRVIYESSPLGILGEGDGSTRSFNVKVFPIDEFEDIDVFVDGSQISDSRFDVNHRDGVITFKTAPEDGAFLTITYKLAKTAPEPPSFFVFFTFNEVNLSRLVGEDTPVQLTDGDGETKEFPTPTKPIKHDSMYVYMNGELVDADDYELDLSDGKIMFNTAPPLGAELTVRYITIVEGATLANVGDGDGENADFWTVNAPIAEGSVNAYINGVIQLEEDYEVDYEEGKITFNTPPVLGAEITISYIDLTGGSPSGIVQLDTDIRALKIFDPYDPKSLMDAVYESLDYRVPSLPTVLDFVDSQSFGHGWQRDSYIYTWGNINKNRAMMFMRPDPTADAEIALFAPLYFGRIHTKGLAPRKNMIIASGAAPIREINYQANIKLGGIPVDYGKNTSNGNQGVQLAQGIGGAYYQQHYLKFHTVSQEIDNGEGKFSRPYIRVNTTFHNLK